MKIFGRYIGKIGLVDLGKMQLSELITVASNDLARAIGRTGSGYVVDMGSWGHRYDDGACFGCYAGQCLLRRVPDFDDVERGLTTSSDYSRVASTLNEVRLGNIRSALRNWHQLFIADLPIPDDELQEIENDFFISSNPSNEKGYSEFIKATRGLVKQLEKFGL